MMSDQRILDRLGQMRAALSAIERLTADKSLDDYAAEPDLAAAVERYLERHFRGVAPCPRCA